VFGAAAERVRRSDFAHIERRKRGTRRGAPVFYRLSRPMLTASARTTAASTLPPPQPSAPESGVGALPACSPDDLSPSSDGAGGTRARTTLRDLRRRLEARASARGTWWGRLYEPLMRIIARLQAVVAGRWASALPAQPPRAAGSRSKNRAARSGKSVKTPSTPASTKKIDSTSSSDSA
jgi:hypothetical protein